MRDQLGTRIAKHRAQLGWTQADLAERVGISRTALSHLEAGMKHPGERTVALLAGVFKVEPHELVEGTDYPMAKAERLPLVVARYTEVEHLLALLEGEEALWPLLTARQRDDRSASWRERLRSLDPLDERERAAVRIALERVGRSAGR